MTDAENTQVGQVGGSGGTGGVEKQGGSGLTVLVTIVAYAAYAVVLYKNQNAEMPQKLLAGGIFLVLAPIGVAIGGIIGRFITPRYVIASGAAALLQARLFWWVGPRFVGAGVAAFLATIAGAPTILP